MYVKVKGKVASVGELATISTKNCDEELRMLCMMIELELVGEDIGGGGVWEGQVGVLESGKSLETKNMTVRAFPRY